MFTLNKWTALVILRFNSLTTLKTFFFSFLLATIFDYSNCLCVDSTSNYVTPSIEVVDGCGIKPMCTLWTCVSVFTLSLTMIVFPRIKKKILNLMAGNEPSLFCISESGISSYYFLWHILCYHYFWFIERWLNCEAYDRHKRRRHIRLWHQGFTAQSSVSTIFVSSLVSMQFPQDSDSGGHPSIFSIHKWRIGS